MRKFEITLRVDGFDGELFKTIKATNRGAADAIARASIEGIELDIADVGIVEEEATS